MRRVDDWPRRSYAVKQPALVKLAIALSVRGQSTPSSLYNETYLRSRRAGTLLTKNNVCQYMLNKFQQMGERWIRQNVENMSLLVQFSVILLSEIVL